MKQSSSEPLEEKPFLTKEEEEVLSNIFEKATARISELERSVKYWQDQCRNLVERRNEYESSLESELKALREENERLNKEVVDLGNRWT